ncbi:hypothetical protein SAMN05421780_1234 [Flexibacter flexilis DSM 6793]|uniref:Anti-bacteriophage protein A/HamA C-terminal domain-containing protein n=1 Tax=Flexibacter flexilis DSM 6793 TaxID=927664 RepID=A0A1I1NWX8_9BACT|nr:hypothetical protein [Flexibacter flexilis]SFD02099.1 hypothetical protein SAMN05421780_1234 [Flexibacter flexilis DSM 6793]
MEITKVHASNVNAIENSSGCKIHSLYLRITNWKSVISEFETHISDTSWIGKLNDKTAQISFRANVERTINKIVNDIIAKVSSSVNKDIGEYLISYTAQCALEKEYRHQKIPLAELWKEKVSGNPGFDFHTISSSNYLIFGEAKFSLSVTPREKALNQIEEFIGNNKDSGELIWLKPFLDETTLANITNNNEKGYTAAFSFNNESIDITFTNALTSSALKEITKHKELYLIAIEIC